MQRNVHTTFGFEIDRPIPDIEELNKIVAFCAETEGANSMIFANNKIRVIVVTMFKGLGEYGYE